MSIPTSRFILYDKDEVVIGDLNPGEELRSAVSVEKINEEHSLTLVTTRTLEVGTRILNVDNTGKWREWVVSEPDEEHAAGDRPIGTYNCIWSLQYDLMSTPAIDTGEQWDNPDEWQPGMGSEAGSAQAAVAVVLSQTSRWSPGTVTVEDVPAGYGAVLMGESAWDLLSKVVERWGGEVDATIVVRGNYVAERRLDLVAHLGSDSVTRRFDWGQDVNSIRRTPDPGPYYCRVIPQGGSHKEYAVDDETEIEYPHGIEEETCYCVYRVKSVPDPKPTYLVPQTVDDLWRLGYVLETVGMDIPEETTPITPDDPGGGINPVDSGSGSGSSSGGSSDDIDVVNGGSGSSSGGSSVGGSMVLTPQSDDIYDADVPTPTTTDITNLHVGDVFKSPNPRWGVRWVQDDEAAMAFRVPDGNGGWEYPTKYVKYSTESGGKAQVERRQDDSGNWTYDYDYVEYSADDPELLLKKAMSDLHNHTRPKVVYSADVEQFAKAGMDVNGIALGDDIHIVDRGFSAPLRLRGRVLSIEEERLSGRMRIEVGQFGDSLTNQMSDLIRSSTSNISNDLAKIKDAGTIVYLKELLKSMSSEINSTGGYVYYPERDGIGEGIVIYDIPITDPYLGYNADTNAWASQVVQLKGGSIRISNHRNAAFGGLGDWDWNTVFVGGHVAAELVTAANITTGFARDVNDNLVIDFDHGTMTFKRGRIQSADGKSYWSLTDNEFHAVNAYLSGTIYATSGEIGGFTIEDDPTVGKHIFNNSIDLRDNGLHITSAESAGSTITNAYSMGIIGVSNIDNQPAVKGIVFDLDAGGSYMSWGARTDENGAYYHKLVYYNKEIVYGSPDSRRFEAGWLYSHCSFGFMAGAYFENGIYLRRLIDGTRQSIGTVTSFAVRDTPRLRNVYGVAVRPESYGDLVAICTPSSSSGSEARLLYTPVRLRMTYKYGSTYYTTDLTSDSVNVMCDMLVCGATTIKSDLNVGGSSTLTNLFIANGGTLSIGSSVAVSVGGRTGFTGTIDMAEEYGTHRFVNGICVG